MESFDEVLVRIVEYCYLNLRTSESNVPLPLLAYDYNSRFIDAKSRLNYLVELISNKCCCNENEWLVTYNAEICREFHRIIEMLKYDLNLELYDELDEMIDIFIVQDAVTIKQIIDWVVELREKLNAVLEDRQRESGGYLWRCDLTEPYIAEPITRHSIFTTTTTTTNEQSAVDEEVSSISTSFTLVDRLVKNYIDAANDVNIVGEIDEVLSNFEGSGRWYVRRALVKRLTDIKAYVTSAKCYENSLISYDSYIEEEIRDIDRCLNDHSMSYNERNLFIDCLILRYKFKKAWEKVRSCSKSVHDCLLLTFSRLCTFVIRLLSPGSKPCSYQRSSRVLCTIG